MVIRTDSVCTTLISKITSHVMRKNRPSITKISLVKVFVHLQSRRMSFKLYFEHQFSILFNVTFLFKFANDKDSWGLVIIKESFLFLNIYLIWQDQLRRLWLQLIILSIFKSCYLNLNITRLIPCTRFHVYYFILHVL